MNYTKLLKITTILVLLPILSFSQELINNRKEIGFDIGIKRTTLFDKRLSNQAKKGNQLLAGLFHNKWNDKRRVKLRFEFSLGEANALSQGIDFRNIQSYVDYSYLRKVRKEWIGVTSQHQTLLIMPWNTDRFGNNPISYAISQSLGLEFERASNIKDGKNWDVQFDRSIQTSLLSYLIRPAHGHPYPEKYLKEGVFKPTRQGMAPAMIKSGKLYSINRNFNLNVVLGLSFIYRDSLKLGMTYKYNHNQFHDRKGYSKNNNDLYLSLSYIY